MEGTDRFSRALISAEMVYETSDRARQWLGRPNPRLNGRAPSAVLESDDGLQQVQELLGQIDEGFFV
jgi:uncharacterized protein (DUF2384 family)